FYLHSHLPSPSLVSCSLLFLSSSFSLFYTDTSPTDLYTLSLHDALPIFALDELRAAGGTPDSPEEPGFILYTGRLLGWKGLAVLDRKSTRLNSSHVSISYAVFCLKKKKTKSEQMMS